jgi:urate oxidase
MLERGTQKASLSYNLSRSEMNIYPPMIQGVSPMSSTTVESKSVENENWPGELVENAYGKSRVRLSKISRRDDRHELDEISINIQLQGDFAGAYITGDNSQIVATDSMKNTVYVLAAKNDIGGVEKFGKLLAKHFLDKYKQTESCTVTLAKELWQRIDAGGKPHQHAFYGAGSEKRSAVISATRKSVEVISHIEGLQLAKTTDSEFHGFVRDEYTTLPEVKDRIFGTSVDCRWKYVGTEGIDYTACYEAVRSIIFEVFAAHKSLGVQHTMHEIGQIALARRPEISEIKMTMPNQHRIPFNLKPFGVEDKNEVFILTDEPYGLISATIRRKS